VLAVVQVSCWACITNCPSSFGGGRVEGNGGVTLEAILSLGCPLKHKRLCGMSLGGLAHVCRIQPDHCMAVLRLQIAGWNAISVHAVLSDMRNEMLI
jgi:hypothetical protein